MTTEKPDTAEPWTIGRGRKPGARNKRTRTLEAYLDANMQRVVESMVEAAKGGDAAAARIVIGLRRAPAKDKPLSLQLPPLGSPSDATRIAVEIGQQMLRGHVTPLEAQDAIGVLERIVKVADSAEMEERLQVLEKLAVKQAAAGRVGWDSL